MKNKIPGTIKATSADRKSMRNQLFNKQNTFKILISPEEVRAVCEKLDKTTYSGKRRIRTLSKLIRDPDQRFAFRKVTLSKQECEFACALCVVKQAEESNPEYYSSRIKYFRAVLGAAVVTKIIREQVHSHFEIENFDGPPEIDFDFFRGR